MQYKSPSFLTGILRVMQFQHVIPHSSHTEKWPNDCFVQKLAAVNHVRHHGKTRKQSLTIFILRKIYLASANLMLLKHVKLHDSYNNSKKAVLVRMSSLL
jgi:hypothetical protein